MIAKIKKTKSIGQYFTPPEVTSFMVDLITKAKNSRILDPCAGEGVFLSTLLNKGYRNISGIELDKSLINKSSIPIKYGDYLTSDPNDKYDVIIGNPPYVRWKNMPKETQQILKNSPIWKDKLNSLADLLYAFIYLSVVKLERDGELIFITPFFWTSTLHSRPIRKFLTAMGHLEILVMFNEMKIFKNVSSSILIFKFVKNNENKKIRVVNVDDKTALNVTHLKNVATILKRLQNTNNIEYDRYLGYQHHQFYNGNPWKPLPPNIESLINNVEEECSKSSPVVQVTNGKTKNIRLSELLEEGDLEELGIERRLCIKVRFLNKWYFLPQNVITLNDFNNGILTEKIVHRYSRLGDIANIGNGMVSGLDEAFQISEPKKYGKDETRCFVKVAKARNLDRYYINGYTNYVFINHLESEAELSRLPGIKRKLEDYRERLENRYNYNKVIPYWHWVFTRNRELIENNKTKIIVPCKERIDNKGYVRFAFTKGNYYATQDTTVIVKKEYFKEDERYLLAILNSRIIFNWMRYKGLKRGGVLEFSETPLSMIPIRLIDWDNEAEVMIHNKIVSLIDRIIESKSYNEHSIFQIETVLEELYGLRQ